MLRAASFAGHYHTSTAGQRYEQVGPLLDKIRASESFSSMIYDVAPPAAAAATPPSSTAAGDSHGADADPTASLESDLQVRKEGNIQ